MDYVNLQDTCFYHLNASFIVFLKITYIFKNICY